jgi:hypothetical protein
MASRLEYPELLSKKSESTLAIQVNIDKIREDYQDIVWEFARSWVKKNAFNKRATIWHRSDTSVDFPTFPIANVTFVVQCGLPPGFSGTLSGFFLLNLGNLQIDLITSLLIKNGGCHFVI